MKILVVAATAAEVGQTISNFEIPISDLDTEQSKPSSLFKFKSEIEHPKFEILITGVGMVATAFALARHLSQNQYDLVLNLGIAGSFDRNIALGQIVEIVEDTFSELGAEEDTKFLPIEEMGFGEATFHPSTKLSDLYNLFNTFNLTQARAITVNTVHGNEASIQKVMERLTPQIESMEGAAFFYACKHFNVPCMQIRAVSNYVEKRNRANWNIGLAIKNLNTFAVEFLKLYA